MAFHPYVNVAGNCRQAFTHYHEIFGGELTLLSMAEMPSEEPVPAEQADLIMHAALAIGADDLLMGSDAELGEGKGMNGAYVNYSTDDAGEAKRVFDALADGGSVQMPLGETFFSPAFGMCVDRFGV